MQVGGDEWQRPIHFFGPRQFKANPNQKCLAILESTSMNYPQFYFFTKFWIISEIIEFIWIKIALGFYIKLNPNLYQKGGKLSRQGSPIAALDKSTCVFQKNNKFKDKDQQKNANSKERYQQNMAKYTVISYRKQETVFFDDM